jgi:hypothetical protein
MATTEKIERLEDEVFQDLRFGVSETRSRLKKLKRRAGKSHLPLNRRIFLKLMKRF